MIGAGPAGSAAAIEAAGRGLDVLVIDKATFPREKCCGDGLTTGALRRLEGLGLDPTDVPSWQPIDRIGIRPPSGAERTFPLPTRGCFAAVARRSELDAALVTRAGKVGAEVLEGTELLDLDLDLDLDSGPSGAPVGDAPMGARATVVDRATGERSVIEARHLVAADGMWSPTRKLLGLDPDRYRGEWHAFRQYFDGVSGRAAHELLVWFDADLLPGYAWSFPLAGGVANVGFGILRQPGQSVQPMKALWSDILDRPHVREALGPAARPEAAHRAWPIPARLGGLPLTTGPVLFVGDAVAAADPMTGEGIGQAIETGQLAIEAIANHHGDPRAVADHYETALRRGMGRDHRLAAGLGRVLSTERGADLSVRIAGLTGWTRRNFARWLFEDYPRAVLGTPHRWHRRLFTSPGAYSD